MKSAKRIKYFSSISQGQNHIPPPRFQSVNYCLTPLIHLLIIFPSLFYQVRFQGAFPLKFHTHISPSEKVKNSCSFAAVFSIFSPFFSFAVAFWNWSSFSIASRVNKTIPPVFSQDSTLHCQNFSILFRKKLSKDTRHVYAPLS